MRDEVCFGFSESTRRFPPAPPAAGEIEIELGPLRAGERPFVLVPPFDLVAALADRELDRRLVHDAVVDAFEPVIEEADLIGPPLLGIERVHVAAGMDAQLLVLGCGAHIGLGIAAQMQAEAGPVADREHRHGDLVPLRLRAVQGAGVEIIAQPEVERVDFPGVWQLLRGAPQLVMQQMRGEPIGHEHAEDAAVVQRVAIDVGKTFPGMIAFNDGGCWLAANHWLMAK